MLEWLLASIDPARAHSISMEVSWHARFMIVAWTFCIPLGILSARFFKILPRQNWPHELDNRTWWLSHLGFQYLAGIMILIATWMIWGATGSYEHIFWHKWLGWITIALCASQYLAGWLRGTKGGPTDIAQTGTIRGDHFDMTRRRKIFEYFHKSVGYFCLAIALVTIILGLWQVNAPRWMWFALLVWSLLIVIMFIWLQRAGKAHDTYQAIWGNDPELPGNKMKAIGIGVTRSEKSR